ncbi:Ail/Lom family outer membrane beta-barrel protein [Escherichia coli]
MKTPTIPTLLGPDGMTSLREYAGYHGGGSGFGGQLRAWNPPGESVDAALLPNFTRGNARADDLVRNNGYAANAIQLHQDHIVGSFFRLSHRPSWRYLGIGEEEARAFSREVEAAWKEFAEDDCCCIDVERKRTFTMMIREGVAMHAFNGELFVQATWDMAYSRVSTFSGDYLRVTDNKGKTHDVLTGSDDGRHSNTSLAWGAGVQFNPTESVAIDIAYEGSGSGDWRTDGFIVGVGYKF